MSTVAQPALLTAEEFIRLPENGKRMELIDGQIVEKEMAGGHHGYVTANVDLILGNFVENAGLGRVMTCDTFVITKRDPDSVRGSDVCFCSYARLPKEDDVPEEALDQPPDLVFEVKSPRDRWVKILAKTAEYLEAGVSVVCVVDPKDCTVSIYRPDQNAKTLTAAEELSLPDILPGFAVAVGKFFE